MTGLQGFSFARLALASVVLSTPGGMAIAATRPASPYSSIASVGVRGGDEVDATNVRPVRPTRPAMAASPAADANPAPTQIQSTYVVTNNADSGPGSLRQAILSSNSSSGLDQITFNLSGSTRITPLTALPTLLEPILIDGATQPGYAGTPIVEIRGSSAPPGTNALTFYGGSSTVRGLVINGFIASGGGSGGFGIVLDFVGGNRIVNCYVGTNVAGTAILSNGGPGIGIYGSSSHNIIGGATVTEANVLSGNSNGVQISTGSAGRNVVRGNRIGMNASGTLALGNAGDGILMDAPDDTIGGSLPGEGNQIGASVGVNVDVGPSGARTIVRGNWIGLVADGSTAVTSQQNGILLAGASNCVIGDGTAGGRNVIAGCLLPEIYILGPNANDNVIQGNFIGTNAAGTLAFGEGNGIVVDNAANTVVGGTTFGTGNLISGCPIPGLFVATSTNTKVFGNRIGTTASGLQPLGNSKGVVVDNSQGTVIGGATPLLRNVISGNTIYGIQIRNLSQNNLVFGNSIGTDSSGTLNLANGIDGVNVKGKNNRIGGWGAGLGNLIAFNHGAGVNDSTSTGTLIRKNAIYGNLGLGIDHSPHGISANDSLDTDTGSNGPANIPVLDSTRVSGGTLLVNGHLDARRNQSYVLEFFKTDVAHASHFGEGRESIGTMSVACNDSGRANYTFPYSVTLVPNFITATATASDSTTSEFAQCLCTHDADGDGILDCWETQGWGLDVNSDGIIDEDLYAQGARVNHKDVFVELDAFSGQALLPGAIPLVQNAFAVVPNTYVNNPDGLPGVNLHCTFSDTSIAPVPIASDVWSTFDTIRNQWFGTQSEYQSPNARYIKQAKRLYSRYSLSIAIHPDTSCAGEARGAVPHGSDALVIALGNPRFPYIQNPVGHAATFMHELGHTLGLGHGGADDGNRKPNYLSLMNYLWAYPHETWQTRKTWRLDYSRVTVPTLNEAALDETRGFDPPPGIWPRLLVPFTTDSVAVVHYTFFAPDLPADWDNDNHISSLAVQADLNHVGENGTLNSSPGEVLTSRADWPNLVYSFRDSPEFKSGFHKSAVAFTTSSGVQHDLPIEDYNAIDALPPPQPHGLFVMDGQLDGTAQLWASNAGVHLYGHYASNGQLYLATDAPTPGTDLLVVIAETPGALQAAPLGKSGQVAAWSGTFIAHGSGLTSSWGDDIDASLAAISVDSVGAVAEGVVDVGVALGHLPPSLYVAVGKYAAGAGGGLLAQAPAGNGNGNLESSEFYSLLTTTAVPPAPASESGVRLSLAWPSPSSHEARVRLALPTAAHADVRVLDVAGRELATLASGELAAGEHVLVWNGAAHGRRQPAGVYFVVARALGEEHTTRVVLLP